MKIVLWIANEPNQRALACRIHKRYPVAAIVTETRQHKRKITLSVLAEKAIEKIFLRAIGKSWFGMLDHYRSAYPNYPEVPILDVENINSDEAFTFTVGAETVSSAPSGLSMSALLSIVVPAAGLPTMVTS